MLGIRYAGHWGNSGEQNVNLPALGELLFWKQDTVNMIHMMGSVLEVRAVAGEKRNTL